ncbi:Zn-ribbon domain-containing OB-fold protein [Phenylobacterium sp. LH3H17]|uniref:Zn-ribbon domain-containing OB-fold protein n=1 Tax=Phenylobacterium sp. LH3H17 TaxID=2903901 RepID=UPI0020C93A85|nr:Zn-ribbon domain-containing OB-fold protein [Phenylobacterium sp. LH3H17]UTP38288.1 Zn-ribbon domain-containing OB-fold protein [Phenylobacterium sp. LH3H17]
MNQLTPQADVIIPGEWHVRYNYSAGLVASQFLNALRERKILASRCSKSGIAYVPPRAYCESSFERCDSWVEVGHRGVIEAATIVTAAFDHLPPPPYAIAYVRLEGASTALLNFVRGLDLSDVPAAAAKLQPGARVDVRFRDDPEGRITDFHYEIS